MKKTLRLVLAAFMAVAMVAFVSCGKDLFNESNDNGGDSDLPTPGPGLSWVDLGLPSGLLWASCNVGAAKPESLGNYYAWGETWDKFYYRWNTYYYGSDSFQLTKYCSDSSYGYNGFTDTLTILKHYDDVAIFRLGYGARIPTREEWQELIDNTTSKWTTFNDVNGLRFTASNGNSIFLPAAEYFNYECYYAIGTCGRYWSASLDTDCPSNAWCFDFYSGGWSMRNIYRYYGQSVRPVRNAMHHEPKTGASTI